MCKQLQENRAEEELEPGNLETTKAVRPCFEERKKNK